MWGFLPLVALSGELEGLSLPGTEPWEGFEKTKLSFKVISSRTEHWITASRGYKDSKNCFSMMQVMCVEVF